MVLCVVQASGVCVHMRGNCKVWGGGKEEKQCHSAYYTHECSSCIHFTPLSICHRKTHNCDYSPTTYFPGGVFSFASSGSTVPDTPWVSLGLTETGLTEVAKEAES